MIRLTKQTRVWTFDHALNSLPTSKLLHRFRITIVELAVSFFDALLRVRPSGINQTGIIAWYADSQVNTGIRLSSSSATPRPSNRSARQVLRLYFLIAGVSVGYRYPQATVLTSLEPQSRSGDKPVNF